MANVFATKTGNWSDPTVWNTGSLPTAADDVYSNNFTVTVNVTTTVLTINNTSASGINGGGGFTPANGANLTCTATATIFPNQNYITSTLTSGQFATFNLSNISLTSGNNLPYMLQHSGTGTFTLLLSSITLTTGGFSSLTYLRNTSTGTLNLSANINSGNMTGGTSSVVSNTSAGTLNITGNVVGGSGTGLAVSNSGTMSITGNCTASNATAVSSGGLLNVIGNCTSTGSAVAISTSGTANITGTLTGGSSTGSAISSSGTTTHIGIAQASATAPAIAVGSASQLTILTGPLLCSPDSVAGAAAAGVNPCAALRWAPKDTVLGTFTYRMKAEALNGSGARPDREMYFPQYFETTYPAASNVRAPLTYGVGDIYTGAMIVPPPGAVIIGTPVDDTIGTAEVNSLEPEDLWNFPIDSITTPGSIGERLKQISTVGSVGDQIASMRQS